MLNKLVASSAFEVVNIKGMKDAVPDDAEALRNSSDILLFARFHSHVVTGSHMLNR